LLNIGLDVRSRSLINFSVTTKTIYFVALILFCFSREYVHSQDTKNQPYPNSNFIDVDGVTIHYRKWVKNENRELWILLVHGFSGSTYSWSKNIDTFFNAGYNVVAIDVPPFGYSDKSLKLNHSVDNSAELILKFLHQINPCATWHLVGHSMGGGIVAAMSILKPEKVSKVIFVAPSLFGQINPGRSFKQKLISFTPIEWALASVGRLFFITKKRVEKLVVSAYGQKATEDEILGYFIPLNQKGMARAILSSFSRANPSRSMSISDFNSTALAIWGQNDKWVPFERMKPKTDDMENLSIVIIKQTGHNPMETDAELFNKIVLDYLLE
jgi:2-hydroxy-6-oxonona-2,4-dienedioate hydrolase